MTALLNICPPGHVHSSNFLSRTAQKTAPFIAWDFQTWSVHTRRGSETEVYPVGTKSSLLGELHGWSLSVD